MASASLNKFHLQSSGWFLKEFQSVLRSLNALMFINIINLTRWNANPCYSIFSTYLICEAFQTISFFPTPSMIFTAVKLFRQVILERIKHKALTEHFIVIIVVVLKLRIFSCISVLHETKQKKRKQTLESMQY